MKSHRPADHRIVTKRLIIPFLLLMIFVPPFGNQAPEWKEFVSKVGGFSVMMPGTPAKIKNGDASEATKSDIGGYFVDGEDVRYVVTTYEIITYPIPGNVDSTLDFFLEDIFRINNNHIIKSTSIRIGNYPGKEITFENEDSRVLSRAFLVKRIVITLEAATPKSQPTTADLARFLDSFKLTAQPELKVEHKALPKVIYKPWPSITRTEEAVRKQAIDLVTPEYPDHARPRNLVDDVVVEIVIDEDGTVEKATGIKGDAIFYNPAVNAARDSTFKPFTLNGKPIRVLSQLTYHFSPDK